MEEHLFLSLFKASALNISFFRGSITEKSFNLKKILILSMLLFFVLCLSELSRSMSRSVSLCQCERVSQLVCVSIRRGQLLTFFKTKVRKQSPVIGRRTIRDARSKMLNFCIPTFFESINLKISNLQG
jgi:hypothetical protein